MSEHKYSRRLMLSHLIKWSTEVQSTSSLVISEVSGFLPVVLTFKILIEKREHMWFHESTFQNHPSNFLLSFMLSLFISSLLASVYFPVLLAECLTTLSKMLSSIIRFTDLLNLDMKMVSNSDLEDDAFWCLNL